MPSINIAQIIKEAFPEADVDINSRYYSRTYQGVRYETGTSNFRGETKSISMSSGPWGNRTHRRINLKKGKLPKDGIAKIREKHTELVRIAEKEEERAEKTRKRKARVEEERKERQQEMRDFAESLELSAHQVMDFDCKSIQGLSKAEMKVLLTALAEYRNANTE